MAVHTYTRTKTGDTVYCAVYYAPDGRRRVEKVRSIPSAAPKKDHTRARSAAENQAHTQRCAVENGTWADPKAEKPGRLSFESLVLRFLKTYRTRSGRIAPRQRLHHLGQPVPGLTLAAGLHVRRRGDARWLDHDPRRRGQRALRRGAARGPGLRRRWRGGPLHRRPGGGRLYRGQSERFGGGPHPLLVGWRRISTDLGWSSLLRSTCASSTPVDVRRAEIL